MGYTIKTKKLLYGISTFMGYFNAKDILLEEQ